MGVKIQVFFSWVCFCYWQNKFLHLNGGPAVVGWAGRYACFTCRNPVRRGKIMNHTITSAISCTFFPEWNLIWLSWQIPVTATAPRLIIWLFYSEIMRNNPDVPARLQYSNTTATRVNICSGSTNAAGLTFMHQHSLCHSGLLGIFFSC